MFLELPDIIALEYWYCTSDSDVDIYRNESSKTWSDINGYKIYTLGYDLQTLPGGYFYFYVDLPDGYVAKSYTSMKNRLEDTDPMASVEEGAFLPFESIITQKVYLEIIINKGTGVDDSDWAISTSDIYTRDATYDGLIPSETQN